MQWKTGTNCLKQQHEQTNIRAIRVLAYLQDALLKKSLSASPTSSIGATLPKA